MTIIMNPGVYDISNDEYHASEGISRSAIMAFKKAPLHFWHRYINPNYVKPEQSTDMVFGNALHTALLEPDKLETDYIIKPENKIILGELPRLKDVGREKYEEAKKRREALSAEKDRLEADFERDSAGKIVVSEKDYNRLRAMVDAIHGDYRTKEVITDAQYEKSIYWIDPDTELLCKCRPDIWHHNFIVDYKTTKDASEYAFRRAIHEYGYYIQMAMISEGFKHALGEDMTNFIFLAQEKKEPYIPAIYQLEFSALEIGIAEFKRILFEIKECIENQSFPGYPTKLISLPKYVEIG